VNEGDSRACLGPPPPRGAEQAGNALLSHPCVMVAEDRREVAVPAAESAPAVCRAISRRHTAGLRIRHVTGHVVRRPG
jgi:hypothetical protein